MRTAEWINFVYFAVFLLLAWVRPLAAARRMRATLIGLAGLSLNTVAAFSPELLSPGMSAVLRDWMPAPLMLMAYWQAGQFFVGPDAKRQAMLEEFDQQWLGGLVRPKGTAGERQSGVRRWLGAYLELAYLFCYPMVPLALGTLYLAGLRGLAAEFWTVVLPASYACYAMVPWFQTLPPRVAEEQRLFGPSPGWLRALNLRILHRASIQANTFPSAHVAASLAASLAVLRHLPATGGVLVWVSLSIAAAAVLRRYHYVLDVLLGGVVAAIALALALI